MTTHPAHPAHISLMAASLLLSIAARGEEQPIWQVHGFVTQGLFHSSDNNFYGQSDDGVSDDFNETGLNATVAPFKRLRFSVQGIARNAGEYDDGSPRVDYAFADLKLWQGDKFFTGLRAGRVRNPFGLYNETRDVAHTRPSIYIPSVVYQEAIRDVLLTRDGYALYGEAYSDVGTFSFDIGGGKHDVTDEMVAEALLAEVDGIEVKHPKMRIGRVQWESVDARWRLAASAAHWQNDVVYLVPGRFELDAGVLSAQYSTERWQLTAEYLRFHSDVSAGPLDMVRPGEGMYLQYNWYFSNRWQMYGRYEYGVWDRNHRNGSEMQAYCGTVFEQFCYPRHTGYRRDAGLGIRWDVDQHWMAALEVHYLEGTMLLSYLDNRDTFATATYWTLLGLEVAFRF